jgi:hypothetical protein
MSENKVGKEGNLRENKMPSIKLLSKSAGYGSDSYASI